jgi:8-oxo-dGTP diphosphatase
VKKFDCYVVRHADAGKRRTVADEQRPLSRRGRVQAEWIAETLADLGITRLLASPYVRCIETLEPLAALIDVEIEVSDDLGEGNGPAPVLAFLDATDAPIAICSHGDVIGELLEALDERDVPRDDDRMAKGSTWVLTRRGRAIVDARYVPAPKGVRA